MCVLCVYIHTYIHTHILHIKKEREEALFLGSSVSILGVYLAVAFHWTVSFVKGYSGMNFCVDNTILIIF